MYRTSLDKMTFFQSFSLVPAGEQGCCEFPSLLVSIYLAVPFPESLAAHLLCILPGYANDSSDDCCNRDHAGCPAGLVVTLRPVGQQALNQDSGSELCSQMQTSI